MHKPLAPGVPIEFLLKIISKLFSAGFSSTPTHGMAWKPFLHLTYAVKRIYLTTWIATMVFKFSDKIGMQIIYQNVQTT